jgi:hypothetical protein
VVRAQSFPGPARWGALSCSADSRTAPPAAISVEKDCWPYYGRAGVCWWKAAGK